MEWRNDLIQKRLISLAFPQPFYYPFVHHHQTGREFLGRTVTLLIAKRAQVTFSVVSRNLFLYFIIKNHSLGLNLGFAWTKNTFLSI